MNTSGPEPRFQPALERHLDLYGCQPKVLGYAPGRAELIGNHTDYNGGFVLLCALELGTWVTASPGGGEQFRVHATLKDASYEFPAESDSTAQGPVWSRYIEGVIRELQAAGYQIPIADLTVDGDLPIGHGLSSSASLEVAVAKAALELAGQEIDDWSLAKLCQRAEHRHPGVPCGLLDQTGAIFGQKDALLLMDCATLELEALELGTKDLCLVFVDSQSKHALVDGGYRERRAECEDATVQMANLVDREIEWMRDVSLEEFNRIRDRIEGNAFDRAMHVFAENQRCLEGRDALKNGDYEELGRLMFASHKSSRAFFGNSTSALDCLVEIAKQHKACLGAKLCGGGFGGSTVNLLHSSEKASFVDHVLDAFEERTGTRTKAFSSNIGNGAYSVQL